MPGITVAKGSQPFSIPTINISAFLQDPDSEESQNVIAEVRAACRSTGFFQITGHGVPKGLQQNLFQAAAKFFALPFEEKKALDAKKSCGHRGYDVLASQSYQEGIMPDLKEGYYVGLPIPPDDPRCGRFYMGPNVWPSSLESSAFQRPCEEYYATIFDLSIKVISLIARTLPYGSDVFEKFVANDPAAPLRLLHYPPAANMEGKKQFGASAHTDFGAITLLLQDQNPGLQVLNRATDEWVDVPPNEDAYVFNVGDMLSFWTQGEYVSSVHRVINKNPTDRYSVVFFFDGNLDCSLDPLDGGPGEGKTVESHMLERMRVSYGK